MYEFKTALNQNTFLSLKILEALMQQNLTEEEKAKIIAEGFAELEKRYPDLKNVATKTDLSETELRLIKEIENTRKEIKELDVKLSREIKEVELKLTKEIEDTRKEIKELDVKLSREIKELDVKLSKEIKETKSSIIKWSFLFWISQMGALLGIGFFVFKALKL